MKIKPNPMSLQTQLPYWLFLSAIIVAIINNLLNWILKTESGIFRYPATYLFLAFFLLVIFDIIYYAIKKKPADLWRLGWLGIIGIFGFFNPGLYAFFRFFGFFGFKIGKK